MPALPSRISRYEILDHLGEGGMGDVYLARDPLLERTVAIKVLKGYNTEVRERFFREARSAASLKHQHIVTIYDIGEDQGQPFLAMEFVDGETLAELIKRRPPMGLGRKLQIVQELCGGLSYAHRRKIVHRDIKPANVMITSEGVVKLVDFGLARIIEEATNAGLTRDGAVLGTPHYMSPEQVEGRPADERSDIFAVGLVFYELLSYRKAYPGEDFRVVWNKILNVEPPRLNEICGPIDSELERLVHKAMEKAPNQRYQSLTALGIDLKAILERLSDDANEPTVRIEHGREGKREARHGSDAGTPSPTPRNIPNLDSIARRRAAQISQYLNEAQRHFNEGRFEAAIEQCELAAVLDPHHGKVLDLLHAAHRAIEDRQVAMWLKEAEACLSRGALSEAEPLIGQSLQLRPESLEAQQLHRVLQEKRREQERARERARMARSAVDRARINFAEEAFEAAIRAAAEALGYDPGNSEAQALKERAVAALNERRRALDAVAGARELAAEGKLQQALDYLRAFTPAHPAVEQAAAEIAEDLAALERRRKEEERRRQEEEKRRQEEERRRLEEARRREEDERRRREEEAAARRRREEEVRRQEEDNRARANFVGAKKVEARNALAAGRFDDALAALASARTATPADPEIDAIARAVATARSQAEEAATRRRTIDQNLADAKARMEADDLAGALKIVESALRLDPNRSSAVHLRHEIGERIETKKQAERSRRLADAAASKARTMFVHGDYDAAIRLLEEFEPRTLVAGVIAELETEWRKLQTRKREEAARLAAEAAREAAKAAEAEAAREAARAAQQETSIAPVDEPERDLAIYTFDDSQRSRGELDTIVEPEPRERVERTPIPAPRPRRISRAVVGIGLALVALVLLAVFVGPSIWPLGKDDTVTTVPIKPPEPAPTLQQYVVSVNAVPWARVRIVATGRSSEVIERTTPFSISLPEGEYRIEFEHPAFTKVARTYRVGAGQNASINQTMPGADVNRIVSDVFGGQ